MTPVLGIIASSNQQGRAAGPVSAYEPLAVATVPSGGVASITFGSIPQTYTHLQIRVFAQTNRATYGRDAIKINVNSDTGNNYSWHEVFGDGSGAFTNAFSSVALGQLAEVGTGVGSTFGVAVIDLLDYANTSKYKTIRSLFGGDHNGTIAGFGGTVGIYSTLWQSTTALSSVTLAPVNGSQFNQYSSFALYGIKGN
jgi:hypothetical protein